MTASFGLPTDWRPRLAREEDVPALEALVPASVLTLQSTYYSVPQMKAALGSVFGVDRQLIRDGTYFVVEYQTQIVGCGGWSRRRSLYGSDSHRMEPDAELDQSPTQLASEPSLYIRVGRVAGSGVASWQSANEQ